MIYWLILIFIIFLAWYFKIDGKRLLYFGLIFIILGSISDILNVWKILEPLFSFGLTIWVVGIIKTWGHNIRKNT